MPQKLQKSKEERLMALKAKKEKLKKKKKEIESKSNKLVSDLNHINDRF